MKYVWSVMRWLLALLLALLAASMALLGNWNACVLLAASCVLCLPLIGGSMSRRTPRLAKPIWRLLLVLVLLFAAIRLMSGTDRSSIIIYCLALTWMFIRIYGDRRTVGAAFRFVAAVLLLIAGIVIHSVFGLGRNI